MTENEPIEGFTDEKPTDENQPQEGQSAGEPTDTMAESADTVAAEEVDWQDRYLRLVAEFDNYRKRTLKEKMELVSMGGEQVIKELLGVVDDMDRALEAMAKTDDPQAIKEGVSLIHQKMTETLKAQGVQEIEAMGEVLDTDLHEAVAKFAAGDEQRGRVIDVIQKGYKLKDKVARYAKVVVGE